MAIVSSAAESPATMKRKNSGHEQPTEEEDNKKKNKIDVASGSGASNQPKLINRRPPVPGVPKRIGKTCHQCRQTIKYFAVQCQAIKKNKQCTIKLCAVCLSNRYGEKVDDVAQMHDWICPKCRGICNCSFCRKKRGVSPTGNLARQAKAYGFSSVAEYLEAKDSGVFTKPISPKKLPASDEDCGICLHKEHEKENNYDQAFDASSEPMEMDDAEKDEEPKEVEIILPHGTEITNVADADFPADDVGNALQFIEFCCTFGEVLDIKKRQAESILCDIIAGRSRPGKTTLLIQFQVKLLTLIRDQGEVSALSETDDDKHFWLDVLKDHISRSKWVPKELAALNFETNDGYCTLGSSEKLRLLVFLCDETLETVTLRAWIEEQNLKFCEERKEARSKLLAAKEKEKLLKKQLHDEVAKDTVAENAATASIAEHEAVVAELKADIESTHAEILETTTLKSKHEKTSNALRTEPVFIDTKGHAFWSLKGCNNSDLLLQDISSVDEEKLNEKWFSFEGEEIGLINEHISLQSSIKRPRRRRAPRARAQAQTQAPVAEPTTQRENADMNAEDDLNEVTNLNHCEAKEGSGGANENLIGSLASCS